MMKRHFLILMLAAGAVACSVEEDPVLVPGDPDLDITLDPVQPADTAKIDTAVFALLNLDYPGLEDVKIFYEAGDTYSAADRLLEYYRQRRVVNPFVSLLTPSVTSEAAGIAEQATKDGKYCFKVSNFYEDEASKQSYSFAVKDEKNNVTGLS